MRARFRVRFCQLNVWFEIYKSDNVTTINNCLASHRRGFWRQRRSMVGSVACGRFANKRPHVRKTIPLREDRMAPQSRRSRGRT